MFTTLSLFPEEVSSSMTLSEKLSSIFSTAIIGFLVVFAVLAIIWGILEIFGKIFGRETKTDKLPEKAVVSETVATEPTSDERETVAAIAAAISAYTDKPITSFRVVSFKKAKRK